MDKIDGDCIVGDCVKRAAFCGDHDIKKVYAVMYADRCSSCHPERLEAVFSTEELAREWIGTNVNPGRFHVETLAVQDTPFLKIA
jgi:hypothetical protein